MTPTTPTTPSPRQAEAAHRRALAAVHRLEADLEDARADRTLALDRGDLDSAEAHERIVGTLRQRLAAATREAGRLGGELARLRDTSARRAA